MLKPAFVILILASACAAQDAPDIAGTWSFTQDGTNGTIVLRQNGTELSGTWHTSVKAEPDTLVAARVYGKTVMLTRAVGSEQQTYILTLSADGKRLDGFGQGALNHAHLLMVLVAAAPKGSSPPAAVDQQNRPLDVSHFSQQQQSSRPVLDAAGKPKKQTWMGIGLPPTRGTYTWIIQSVALHGAKSGKKYSSYYYEVSTTRTVEESLSLPRGGEIVGVFPDDCAFAVQDQSGHAFTFRNEREAQARGLGPGMWSVYPLKCSGIDVFVK
jgi:hypothetical protein